MAANRWADEGSHPNVRPFVRRDEARDAVDLELTDPMVPWVYFYKFWEPSSRGLTEEACSKTYPNLSINGRSRFKTSSASSGV